MTWWRLRGRNSNTKLRMSLSSTSSFSATRLGCFPIDFSERSSRIDRHASQERCRSFICLMATRVPVAAFASYTTAKLPSPSVRRI